MFLEFRDGRLIPLVEALKLSLESLIGVGAHRLARGGVWTFISTIVSVGPIEERIENSPGLRAKDPAARRKVRLARQDGYMGRLNEAAQDWVPHVRRLRPDMAWEDVLRIINGPLPEARRWTQSRLLRAVNAYVRDGFLPETVLGRAGRRETDDRLPAIVAAIKGADPDITLQAICNRLEAMRERTPRGRTSWQPSSVKMLLERAERLGLLD